ncbi:BON domain-containing protein [Actinoplanes sp. NPDC051851]|uniref:BON domain-containing protein n=1 Tax=Actinoplanes sp. NPDC051851 TaxID=3154753 RepID=UPI003437C34C
MSPFWEPTGDTDQALVARAAWALRDDPLVRGVRLEILVQNGVVILTGEVESADASRAASRAAWDVPGVHDVCNRLLIAGLGKPLAWEWPV